MLVILFGLAINPLRYSFHIFFITYIIYFIASQFRGTSNRRARTYFLTKEDYINGAKIDEDNEIPKDQDPVADAMEDGYGYQGDMDLNAEEASFFFGNEKKKDSISSRAALTTKKWPRIGSNVFIPYVLSGEYDKDERANIARAFEDFENNTCLR